MMTRLAKRTTMVGRRDRCATTTTTRATTGDDADADDADAQRPSRAGGEVKVDPFGFGSRRQDEPDKIIPGFDTAEGGKVGPLGTAAISALLFVLFGGSFFFTSVPRNAVLELAARELADDPNAPTQSFR
jgi:hypothetical protein